MSLLRKAILVNSAEGTSILIGVAQTIILTRVLGPSGIGQYSVISSTLMLAAQLWCLGFPLSYLYHSQHDPVNTKQYLMNTIWVNLVLGVIGGIIMTVVVHYNTEFFGQIPWFSFIAIGLFIPIVLQSGIARQNLMIKIEAKKLSIMVLTVTIGGFSLVCLFALLGYLAIGQAIICFVSLAAIRAVVGWHFMKGSVDWHIRPSWNVSRKLALMGIRQSWSDLMVLFNSTLSIMLVKYFLHDFENAGYYSRGQQIAMLVVTAGQAILPLLFSTWAAASADRVAIHVEKVMRFITTACLVMIVGILLTGKYIILIMYGKEFLPAVIPMMIVLPGAVLYLMSRALMQLAGSRGAPELNAFVLFLAAAVNTLLSWIMIPSWGIHGAALAATSANIVLLAMLMLIASRKYQIRLAKCLLLNANDWKDIKAQLSGMW
jgi:O-antigen/teichoic acid export membrane protein